MQFYPTRNDKRYVDVEYFESFELSHCIAYELHYRANLINIKDIMNYTGEEYKKPSELFFKKEGLKLDDIKINQDTTLKDIVNEFYPSFLHIIESQKYGTKKIDDVDNLSNSLSFFIREFLSKNYLLYSEGEEENDKTLYTTNIQYKFNEVVIDNKVITKDKLINIIKQYNKRITIKPNYSRPDINRKDINVLEQNLLIEVNINQPKEEIQKYIAYIHKEFSERKNKTLSSIDRNMQDIKREFPRNRPPNLRNKETSIIWADWLFIYDYFKIVSQNKTVKKDKIYERITRDLSEYHAEITYKKSSMRLNIIDDIDSLIKNKNYTYLIRGNKLN